MTLHSESFCTVSVETGGDVTVRFAARVKTLTPPREGYFAGAIGMLLCMIRF